MSIVNYWFSSLIVPYLDHLARLVCLSPDVEIWRNVRNVDGPGSMEGFWGIAVNLACLSHSLPLWGPMADTLGRVGAGIFFILSRYPIKASLSNDRCARLKTLAKFSLHLEMQFGARQAISYRHIR